MIKDWIDQILDFSVLFSFDRSGYKRHCPNPLDKTNLSGRHGIITGASSGIGLAAAKALVDQGMDCELIGRDLEKLETYFKSNGAVSNAKCHRLDMSDLMRVYSFAKHDVKEPVDLLIHNAGSMPLELSITADGYEQMFATQVLAPYILTKALAEMGKLRQGCRIIFVSSGGMYLQKLDLSDLLFKKSKYNKYTGYANAKRAQVILSELFSEKYPEYKFSAMHPGWADTPGVRHSMSVFTRVLNKRLRTSEEGADTILWLATTNDYPNGKFWFDRKQAKTSIKGLYESTKDEDNMLWNYCESVYKNI